MLVCHNKFLVAHEELAWVHKMQCCTLGKGQRSDHSVTLYSPNMLEVLSFDYISSRDRCLFVCWKCHVVCNL